MKNETITVLLPTYNRPELLPRALKCVADQRFRDWRCLVVNDGGADVAALVAAMDDPRFEYFDRPHLGKPAALNFGLSQARGEYIAYMDDDDEIFPEHLELLYRAAVRNGSGFVFSDTYATCVERSTGEVLNEYVENDKDVTPEMLTIRNYINHKQILHKKELADRIGGYDVELPVLIDYDFIKRLAKAEAPLHVRATTGRHYLYHDNGRITTISGLWERDPEACGRAVLRIFGKSPADMCALYMWLFQAIARENSMKNEIRALQGRLDEIHSMFIYKAYRAVKRIAGVFSGKKH